VRNHAGEDTMAGFRGRMGGASSRRGPAEWVQQGEDSREESATDL
jgi:hypothetical protein